MRFRHERYKKTEVLTEATSYSVDLPAAGILDHIISTIRTYNNGSQYSSITPHIHDHITKIQVKGNGSEPLYDVRGETCLAQYAFEKGVFPPGHRDVMSSNYQVQSYIVPFGRYPFDGKYALDLARETQIKMEITNDFTTSELQATKNIWLDIDLVFLEEPLEYTKKFFKTYEFDKNTWTAVSQEKTFKLPKKAPIREILLGCFSTRSAVTEGHTEKSFRNLRYLKYTHKSGNIVIKDDDLYRHPQDMLWGYPDWVRSWGAGESVATYYMDTMLCRPMDFSMVPAYSGAPTNYSSVVMDQRIERYKKYRKVEDANMQNLWTAGGYGPLDHIRIAECVPDIESRYLDPNAMADVEVKVGDSSDANGSGTIRCILQTLQS